MPYYILESPEETLTVSGVPLHGISTTGYSPLWLYVVSTEERPMDWPESPTGKGCAASPRTCWSGELVGGCSEWCQSAVHRRVAL